MMTNPEFTLLPGGQLDSVERRILFECAHPEVTIIPPANPAFDRWRAIVPLGSVPSEPDTTTIGDYDLTRLLNRLDVIFPPGEGS